MKIGFVSLPVAGHLNPMTALARTLQSRGHDVVYIGVPDVEPFARAAGLDFVPYCEDEYPAGSIARLYAPVSKLHALDVARSSVRDGLCDLFSAGTKHLPQTLADTGVEALVLDPIHAFLELVPMSLGMPYVQVWGALQIDLSGTSPPCFFSWPHESTPEALRRNRNGVEAAKEIFAPITPRAMAYAEQVGLHIDWSDGSATMSKLAVIAQTPKEFDFPGIPWPPQFHYTGPFHDDDGREAIDFPWYALTGSPLVYASMGTIVNGREHVYRILLQAAAELPEIQLVLSVGDNVDLDDVGTTPANTIVVHRAPQIEILTRAALCVTHAGLNTVLESLARGVPMVAIPVGYDQPGVAARIAHHGVGEFVELEDLSVRNVRRLIRQVSSDPRYRRKARWFQRVIAQRSGLEMAAGVIERAFDLVPAGSSERMAGAVSPRRG